MNDSKYISIFDQPFFHELKKLHEEYNAKFTLYTYYKFSSGDSIVSFPSKFKEELKNNSSWLKFGFHAFDSNFSIAKTRTMDFFSKSYEMTANNIERFAGRESISKILRLHYWFATKEEILYLKAHGVACLLSCDKEDRENYSLNAQQRHVLHENGSVYIENMRYLRTELRIEQSMFPFLDLFFHEENDTLVIFTHEWALRDKINKIKLNKTISLLNSCGCKFIN